MRKKVLALLLGLAMLFVLASCSNGGHEAMKTNKGDKSEKKEHKQQVLDPINDPTKPEYYFGEEVNSYYFKDGVAESEGLKIEITDWKVLQPGEGDNIGDEPLLAFWFNATNIDRDEEFAPWSVWNYIFSVIQDNNPNAINELNVITLPDRKYMGTSSEIIKKGGTVASAIGYRLEDTTTPVVLRAALSIGGDVPFDPILGEQTFNIAE